MSFISSTNKDYMPVNRESGFSDQFGTVRTISSALNGMQDSSDFLATATSGKHTEATKATVIIPGTSLRELEAEYERPLRQREEARVSTSTKLLLVDDDLSIEGNGTASVGELTKELRRQISPGSFYNVPPTDKWPSRETKLDSVVDVEGVLFPIHDLLGQIIAIDDGTL